MIKNLLQWRFFKGIAIAVLVAFVSAIPAQCGYAQTFMPAPGQMVHGTATLRPTLMKGLRVDVSNPFNLYFVMSDGEKALADNERQDEYEKLIKYFMASLVIPNRDMWVNLSPKESTRIIPDNFSMTEMGRDLLAQDYLLKQFTASLMYPEDDLGREFWSQIYKKAYQEYGTTDIPVDTFNKVWIKADQADIYQKGDTAFLVKSHLKVMLEQDLVAAEGDQAAFVGTASEDGANSKARKLATDIVRNVIIPVIEKEVNEGANFSSVRQAYHAMILATWFKKTLKSSLLGQVYADQSKVEGIALNDPQAKDRIYEQYLAAYKTGVFNYIKEEHDALSQETLPRKYFAGGMTPFVESAMNMNVSTDAVVKELNANPLKSVAVDLDLPSSIKETIGRAKPVKQSAEVHAGQRQDEKQLAPDKKLEEKLKASLKKAKQETAAAEAERAQANATVKRWTEQLKKAEAELKAVKAAKKSVTKPAGKTLTSISATWKKFVTITALAISLAASWVGAAPITNSAPGQPAVSMASAIVLGPGSSASFTINTNAIQERESEIATNNIALQALTRSTAILKEQKEIKKQTVENLPGQIQLTTDREINALSEQSLTNRIAWLKQLLQNNKDLDKSPMQKVGLPFTLRAVFENNFPLAEYTLTGSGVSPAFIVDFNHPFKRVLEGIDISSGIASGSSTALGTVIGPVRLVEIMMSYGNQFKAEGVKGQDKKYDLDNPFWARMGITISPFRYVSVESADQNGAPRKFRSWDSSWLHNFRTLLAQPGRLLPKDWVVRKIFGDPDSKAFTFMNPGVVFEADKYHKVFNWIAAHRTEGQKIALFNVFQKRADKTDQYVLDKKTHGFKRVDKDAGVTDPFSEGWVNGYLMVENADGTSTVYNFYSAPTMVNNEMMQQMAGSRKATVDSTVIQPVWSTEEIERELAIREAELRGDDQGVLGIQRLASGAPVKAITNYDDLLDTETNPTNGVTYFRFGKATAQPKLTAAKAVEEPSASKKIGRIVVEEFTNPFYQVEEMLGLGKVRNVAKKFDYTQRPVVDKLPSNYENNRNDRFEAGRVLQAIDRAKQDENNVGALYRFDGKLPEVIKNAGSPKATFPEAFWKDTFWMVKNLDKTPLPQNAAVEDENNIRVTFGKHTFLVKIGSMVKVEDGKIVGVFQANVKTMKEWVEEAKQDIPVLEARRDALLNQAGIVVDLETTNTVVVTTAAPYVPIKFVTAPNLVFSNNVYVIDGKYTVTNGTAMVERGADGRVLPKIFEPSIPTIKARNEQLQAEDRVLRNGGVIVKVEQNDGKALPVVVARQKDAEENPELKTKYGIWSESELTAAVADNRTQKVKGNDHGQAYEDLVVLLKPLPTKPGLSVHHADTLAKFTANNVLAVFLREEAFSESEFLSITNNGTSILNKLIEKKFLKRTASGEVQVNQKAEIKPVDIQEIAKDDFDQVWNILHQAQYVSRAALKDPNVSGLLSEASEILRINANGETIGREVRVFNGGYQYVSNEKRDDFLKNHCLVITKNSGTTGFVSLEKLGERTIRDNVRKSAFEIRMIDANGGTAGYVYLSPQPLGSRIVSVAADKTTQIYLLFDYRGILTRSMMEETVSNGGEVFDWLMGNGYFDEKEGTSGRLKELTDDTKALLKRQYSADSRNILTVLRQASATHNSGVYQLDQQHKAIGGTIPVSQEMLQRLDAQHVDGEEAVLKMDYPFRSATIEIFGIQTEEEKQRMEIRKPLRVIDLLTQSVINNAGEGRMPYQIRLDQGHWDIIRDYVQDATSGKPYHRVYPEQITTEHHGMDIPLNGQPMKNLLTLSRVSKADGQVSVDYMDLRDRRPGQYALVGRMVFDKDGNKVDHYTGRTLLPQTIVDGQALLDLITDQDLYKKKDHYFYQTGSDGSVNTQVPSGDKTVDLFRKMDQHSDTALSDGVFDHREVFERRDNDWVPTRTIKGLREVEIGENDIRWKDFIAVPEVRAAMEAQDIDAKTVLQYTPVVTVEGLEIIDYRKQFDPLEKKLLTVHRHKGQIVKIVVATAFDELTGEVTKSFTLNHNYELSDKNENLTGQALRGVGLSNVAGEVFNAKVAEEYAKANGGEDLWDGLKREGIAPGSELIILRVNKRLPNSDGSFLSDHWTPDEFWILHPNGKDGPLAIMRGNGDLVVNPWWKHARLAELQALNPSELPSPNILPGSVLLRRVLPSARDYEEFGERRHEVIAFDRFTTDASGIKEGARYKAVKAEFLQNVTFDLATGRKVREEFREDLSLIARGVNRLLGRDFFPSTKVLNYDPRSNRQSPVNANDKNGRVVSTWKGVSYDSQGNQTQVIEEQHPVFKYQRETRQHYDAYGDEREPEVTVTHKKSLWAALGAILLFPVSVVLRSVQTSKRRNKDAEKIRALPEGRLYDKDIGIAAQQRFASKVLKSLRSDPNVRHLSIEGDSESQFLFSLDALYLQGVSRYIKAHGIPPERYQEVLESDALAAWDQYAINVGRYLAEELSRGATEVKWDQVMTDALGSIAKIAAESAKAAAGSADAMDDVNKLKLKLTAQLKNDALANVLANQQILTLVAEMDNAIKLYAAQEKEVIKRFNIRKEDINEHPAVIVVRLSQQKHLARLKASLKDEIESAVRANNWTDQQLVGLAGNAKYPQVGKSDQQIWDKMEVYLATLRDRLALALDEDITSAERANGKWPADGAFEKVAASSGIVKNKGVEDFYRSFQEFLKENKFEPAPNRIIVDNNGKETYIADAKQLVSMVKNGDLTRKGVDKYVKSLNQSTWRTFLGWGIKAIHPLMLDGTVMPRFVLAGLGLGALTLGAVSLTGWLAAPILGVPAGILLAGAAVILGIGAILDYRKIAHTDQLPLTTRIILAGVALAALAVLVAMPTLGMGIVFIKVSLGLPLLLEAVALTVMHRSNFGLNLYYHYRESSDPGRLRANVLVWAQFFSFIALALTFGWVTYGWFATQLAMGASVKLALALFMFVNTAYLSNFGLWVLGRSIAARLKPSEGAPPPSPLAKELSGLKKDELFLTDYVGPVLGSIGVMKEHIDKPEQVKDAVDYFIKGLLFNLQSAELTLQGIRKKAGIAPEKTMQEFIEQDVRAWMTVLFTKESSGKISLLTDDQLIAEGTEPTGRISKKRCIVYKNEQERQQLIFAKEINQLMSLFSDFKGGLNPYDAAVSLIGQAYMLRDTLDPEGIPLGKKTLFLFTYNNKNEKNLEAIENFAKLFGEISGAEVDVCYSPTAITMKSGAMNGMFALPKEYRESLKRAGKLSRIRKMLVLDRNANSLDLRRDINDIVGSINNPELVGMASHRNTTNTRHYMGVQNFLVEGGQGDALLGFNEKIATGWGNIVGLYNWDALMKLSNPDFPRKSFTPEMRQAYERRYKNLGLDPNYASSFGMVGFKPQAVGMSEDYWQVIQHAYMLIALGYDPKYALSTAIHHKRRETYSNFELSSAVPRWAGGRVQTEASFLNQVANSAESYAEREATRNTGRGYTALPSGLLNLIMLPISVVLGFNPFQGLWLGLAGAGTVLNQVQRLHGLGAMIDDSGLLFGTARFFFYQFRDMSVFAVRVMLETLAIINSYGGMSFMFNISGGGGNAYRVNTWEKFKADPWKFISFKNIVFIGALITGLMVFSTISGLTIAHVLMMFLPMLWAANLLIGLFVSENKPGVPVWNGKGDNIAAGAGALSAVGYAAWVYFQKSAIFALGGYGILMFILYKLVASHPKGQRLVSQFNRYFIRTAAGALLFALVPASTFVKFNIWPNVTWILTTKQLLTGVAAIVGGVWGLIGLGYGVGAVSKKNVENLYNKTIADFWAVRDKLDDTRRIVISQRFHQVNIFMAQSGYKRAKQALEEIRLELAGQVSVVPVPLNGPVSSAKDNTPSANNLQKSTGITPTQEFAPRVILKRPTKEEVSVSPVNDLLKSGGMTLSLDAPPEVSLRKLTKEIKELKAAKLEAQEKFVLADQRVKLARTQEKKLNQALDAVAKKVPVGGIDFNSDHLVINIEFDGNGIPLAAQFQDPRIKNIPGLRPVIRSIQPLNATNNPVLAELMMSHS